MKSAEPHTPDDPPEFFPGEVLEDLGHVPNYNDWIFEQFAPLLHGCAAEIGAGLGTISERLRPCVTTLDLVEPSPELARQLMLKFEGDAGCRVMEQSIETWLETVGPGALDCIIMVNVLEHIENDYVAVQGLYDALKPGGRLLIFVPALPFLYSKLDKVFGHFRRYTRKSLRTCVGQAGFRIEKLRYFDISGVLPWWLLNTVLGKISFNQSMLTVYDRVVVPPTKLVESILAPPLGKNLILIAVKE
jgi:SAM-dependent methyltransferase